MTSHIIQYMELCAQLNDLQKPFALGKVRKLRAKEIRTLKRQGNHCDSWDLIQVSESFVPNQIFHSRFSGVVYLGFFGHGCGIYYSSIGNSEVGSHTLIEFCPSIKNCIVSAGCKVLGSSIGCTSKVNLGLGTEIHAGLETSGKNIRIWDQMTIDSAQRYLREASFRSDVDEMLETVKVGFSFIGEQVEIHNSQNLDGVYFEPGCRIQGASMVRNVTVLSSLDEPSMIGPGAIVEDSVLQWGCSVTGGAQVRQSILLEQSAAEKMAQITKSLIGPSTCIGSGEVNSSFLGPCVGLHHQSLLIAAWWPQGRGNIAYGANVGSNHTSRLPDQEIWPGEGSFYGLGVSIKFPANFQESPYSVFSTGITTLPQKISFPFSLVLEDRQNFFDCPPGYNRIIPAWGLRENLYSVLRNENKFRERFRAIRNATDFRIYRPEIVEYAWSAWDRLKSAEPVMIHTHKEILGLGKNFLLEQDRLEAIKAYEFFLSYSLYRLNAEMILGEASCDQVWLTEFFEKCQLKRQEREAELKHYVALEKTALDLCLVSRKKDEVRGPTIIPDYIQYHSRVDDDVFIESQRKRIEIIEEKIQILIGRLA